MSYYDYERELMGRFTNLRMELLSRPLMLGGATSYSGGAGGPIGGFIGYLPQNRVAYDLSEISSSGIPTSGASLLDNLNHIRYRIDQIIASGLGLSVQEDTILEGTGITTINFLGPSVEVNVTGSTATVTISGGTGTSTAKDFTNIVQHDSSLASYVEFAPTNSGLQAALNACAYGDTLWLPDVQFTEKFTFPADVPINVIGNRTRFYLTNGGPVFTINGIGNPPVILKNLDIYVLNDYPVVTGVYGINVTDGSVILDDLRIIVETEDVMPYDMYAVKATGATTYLFTKGGCYFSVIDYDYTYPDPVTATFLLGDYIKETSWETASHMAPESKIGDSTNYVKISETGITLAGTATSFDEIVTELTPGRLGALTKPDWDSTNLGFLFPQNDATEIVYVTAQLPHSYKEGSAIYPQVRVRQAANQQAVFKADYMWYNLGDVIPSGWTTYTMNTYEKTYTSGTISQALKGTGITGTSKQMGSILKIKLYRDDNVYTGDMLCDEFDIVFEQDSFGSNTINTK